MKDRKIVFLVSALLFVLFCSAALADIKPPAEVNQEEGCVIFGLYEQWNNYVEGLEFVENGKEPIEWIVLEQDGTRLFLVSKYPLDYKQYSAQKGQYTWKNSAIRSWLNNTFMKEAFTSEEQAAIQSVKIETGGEFIDSNWPKSSKITTEDKIFLLSYSEVKQYLKTDKVEVNDFVGPKGGSIFANDDSWWLRSSGKKEDEACYAGHARNESGWLTDWRCVRPAMWIDTSLIDWENTPYAKYMQAAKLYEKENYPEAIALMDSLGDYSNSKTVSAAYRYDQGTTAYEAHKYNEAIKYFTETKEFIMANFPDSNEKYGTNEIVTLLNYFDVNYAILESKYQLAIQIIESGDTSKAIPMLEEIGQFKESMDYLRKCYDREHIQYSYLTDKFASINTGLDKGFSEVHNIESNDPHYGWSLGRFMMSGYTEKKSNGSTPVFMKTPGDSMVLWFDLTQNIDELDGNKNLRINSDINGYDQQYQIKASDFGRGMLIVKHTDFRNDSPGIQQYKNYLAANDDTGANTKVEIKEEGIYEVALDYEILKDELIDHCFNYRISFTFEVRNGSGMFFLFDVTTGSELQDYSRTADGFRIDLANSHVLSVSYTRYALNESETGLDVRKTGLASDGDKFEKVGYYEITVTNTETNEKLTKHIFVGRAADLADYKAIDDSLAKFSDQ